MVAIDIALLIIAVVAVVGGVSAYSANRARQLEIGSGPNAQLAGVNRQLAQAARLLDRIVTADQMMPSLPTDLAEEAKKFVAVYYTDR